jgi:hypothetical protein
LRGGADGQQQGREQQKGAHKKSPGWLGRDSMGSLGVVKGVGITPGRSGDRASIPEGERLSPLKTYLRFVETSRTLRAEPDSVRASRTQARSR